VLGRQKTDPGPAILARSGLPISYAQGWLIAQIFRTGKHGGNMTMQDIGVEHKVPAGIFEPTARQLVDAGYLTEAHGHYRYTDEGMELFARLVGSWRLWLLEQLGDWQESKDVDFTADIDRLAERLVNDGRALSTGKHAAPV
jgi:hypothetical protein